jgi:hypothetical protein
MVPPTRTIHAWILASLGIASFCVIYELRTFSSRSWRACLLLAETRPGLGLVATCQRGFFDVWPHAYPRLRMHFLQALFGIVGLAYACVASAHVRQLVAPALDALGLTALLNVDEARIEATPETPAQRKKSLADLPELAWLRDELSPEDDAFDPSRPQGLSVPANLRRTTSETESLSSEVPSVKHEQQKEEFSGNGAEPGGHALHPRVGFVPRALYDRWREAEAERTLAQFARRAQAQRQTSDRSRGTNSSTRSCSRRLPPVRNSRAYFAWRRELAGAPMATSAEASEAEANGREVHAGNGRAHLKRTAGAAAESQSLPSTVSYTQLCAYCQAATDAISGGQTFACSRCGLEEYCSDKCRRAHWKAGHKKSCCAVRGTATATMPLVDEEGSVRVQAMQPGIKC